MDRMSEIARGSLFAAAVCLLATPAAAQLHDHLKCYKVKDPSSFSATVDLRPADGATFDVDAGCTIKVRSRQVCFPVGKSLVTSTSPHLDINGQELANAFLCYKARCPASPGPVSLQMSDQFGTRTLAGLRTSTVCAPAIVGAPPVTTTTTTTLPGGTLRDCVDATPPNCDGTCNNMNLACVEQLGACVCSYYEFQPCGTLAGAPACWGLCDGTNSCLDVSGACQCGFAFE